MTAVARRRDEDPLDNENRRVDQLEPCRTCRFLYETTVGFPTRMLDPAIAEFNHCATCPGSTPDALAVCEGRLTWLVYWLRKGK